MVAMATSLRTSKSAMSSADNLTPKTTFRIKLRVASYHTTKVIANKASYSKLHKKLVAMGTFLRTAGPPSRPNT